MSSAQYIAVGDAGLGSSALGGAAAGGVGGDVGVGGVGLLALTGAGPGTLVLALTGLASLVIGAVAVLTGRKLQTSNDPDSPLVDLSHRTADLA
ncbi:hypothetical protein HC251_03240 [Iamia sp. SCSIO 61187]|uniref:hypothetical protein n=1 Tax=Iamia sp. SCSIO 61187 TaxID=2722752 RepID=UPI001C626071|nr:hypothetical protein [Iamia sp. SCSIO 61187]QYG91549.1 hypothetical protein HC251_03240 [Iamia sp. SCSIO 61187]